MKRLPLIGLSLALLLILAGCGTAPPEVITTSAVPAARAPEASVAPSTTAPSKAVSVPRVKGKTATGAKWKLESAGFKVKVTWVRDPSKRGRVIAQEPSGATAKPGSTIQLTVSTGAGQSPASKARAVPPSPSSSGDRAAARAFRDKTSGVRLTGSGVVTKSLSDDASGSRHQRFILRLASGQTLLVAHNIDIAPRLAALQPGDTVGFNGVYEWNMQGGTVHWTHHDPSGKHPAGWLKYGGSTFQ